jgi:hypothetical protein
LQGCYDCKKDYKKVVKPSLIDGIITGRDSLHNHGIPIIEIQNKDSSVESFGLDNSLTPLWYAIHNNDSIYKAKNSLAFPIIKKDTTLTFYPVCGCCDTLK